MIFKTFKLLNKKYSKKTLNNQNHSKSQVNILPRNLPKYCPEIYNLQDEKELNMRKCKEK